MDYTLKSIKKTVEEKYPNEPGVLSISTNDSTSPEFAFAVFSHGDEFSRDDEDNEIILEKMGVLNYFGLIVSIHRTIPINGRQFRKEINRIKAY